MLRKPGNNNPRKSDLYSAFRRKVLKRDKYRCQMPGCCATRSLQVHHIIRHADSPSGRLNPDNGISLCYTHHSQVTGKESHYRTLFFNIVAKNNGDIS